MFSFIGLEAADSCGSEDKPLPLFYCLCFLCADQGVVCLAVVDTRESAMALANGKVSQITEVCDAATTPCYDAQRAGNQWMMTPIFETKNI